MILYFSITPCATCKRSNSGANVPVTGTGRTLCALIDNKALISRIQKWHYQGQAGTLAPEFDLLQVAQGVMGKYKITVNPEHVKSHQDDTQAYNDLPWQAQLNCDCDQLAGSSQACKQCNDTLHKIYAPPTCHIASLEIGGKFITSHIASAIKEASYCKELTQYITNQSGGRILKHFIVLTGRRDQGQANWCLQGRDLHSLSWSLLCLPQCLGVIRWNKPLTTGAPGAKSSRKHWPMSSNVPVQWNCAGRH